MKFKCQCPWRRCWGRLAHLFAGFPWLPCPMAADVSAVTAQAGNAHRLAFACRGSPAARVSTGLRAESGGFLERRPLRVSRKGAAEGDGVDGALVGRVDNASVGRALRSEAQGTKEPRKQCRVLGTSWPPAAPSSGAMASASLWASGAGVLCCEAGLGGRCAAAPEDQWAQGTGHNYARAGQCPGVHVLPDDAETAHSPQLQGSDCFKGAQLDAGAFQTVWTLMAHKALFLRPWRTLKKRPRC